MHMNQVEERVFTSLQMSDIEEVERRLDKKMNVKIKDFTSQTQEYMQAALQQVTDNHLISQESFGKKP